MEHPGIADTLVQGRQSYSGPGSKLARNRKLWMVLKLGLLAIRRIVNTQSPEDISDTDISRLDRILATYKKSFGLCCLLSEADLGNEAIPVFPDGFRPENGLLDNLPDIIHYIGDPKDLRSKAHLPDNIKESLAELRTITIKLLPHT